MPRKQHEKRHSKGKRRRGPSEGSIFRRTDGRWQAVVSLGWKDGKRWRKNLYGKTHEEVSQKLTAALRERDLGLPVSTERQTVGQYLTWWLATVKSSVRPKSFRTYSDIVKQHLIPTVGRIQLTRLTPQHVRTLMQAKIEAGLSPRTVKHIRDTLRAALNIAVKDGILFRNAAAIAQPPRQGKKELTVYGPREAQRFLEAVRGHRLDALFSVAIALGLRQAEILGLEWNCLDVENAALTVRYQLQRIDGRLQLTEPKTSKSARVIRLPQVAVSALCAHRQRQDQERLLAGSRWVETGLVFTTSIGTPLEPRNLLREFYGILLHGRDSKGRCTCGCRRCPSPGNHPRYPDLPRIRFHDLRHSAATLLLTQGVHPRMVMEMLGHSQIAVTMNTYSHVLPSMQQEAADKMDAVLGPVAVNVAVKEGKERVN